MSEIWTFPWEREAQLGRELPEGISLADQMGFLALRSIYRDYREKRMDRAQAAAEKKKLRRAWEAAKEGVLFGRRVIFEGANDARSESKIRGMTLQGAYCDELTQFPEDFFAMLLSRLRVPGAKLIATTNPDS